MSIFEEENTTDSQNEENNNNDAAPEGLDLIVNKLMEIKRPDGTPKYNDPIAALDALKASQEYISTLETENATYKEQVKEVETLQETIKRLGGNMNNNEKPNPQTEGEGGRSVEAAEELVAKLLDKKLNERDAVNTAVSNVKRVQDTLIKKFGDEAKAVENIKAKAKALNTTPKALEDLAAQNPSLVLELFGGSTAAPSPNNGSVNLSGYKPPVDEIKLPEKSILSGAGATHKNQMELFRQIKERTMKRLNVET